LQNEVWRHAAAPVFARRRIIDARLALTLRAAGVTNLATRNVKDFTDFGFDRVKNDAVRTPSWQAMAPPQGRHFERQ
jgi:hypothetical protein